MHPALQLIVLPFALGGESASRDSTPLALIALVSMVACYVGLAALWWFVFRDRDRRPGGRHRRD